ncbi:hypothetical protein BLNAU_18098 [Blattamonas nauphoetae]|uniref:Deubiquitinating enzyme MINDY-3/4 conserved domain-containing protein n=1 Tax=Blattamonas nauphoetae TaxID=2049346 RepID=A0ABQ9X5A7_9EUKA|nr:hypothetical protein BLNAU_18098 [Blattamonas nauphoetae]
MGVLANATLQIELKKLVITGKTRAHCFVGERQFVESDKDSDSLTLNGIHSRCDIGVLSILISIHQIWDASASSFIVIQLVLIDTLTCYYRAYHHFSFLSLSCLLPLSHQLRWRSTLTMFMI